MKEITAFPFVASDDTGMIINTGMTMRDYFAGRVLQAYESRKDLDDLKVIDKAKRSYHIADAMMEARKQ